MQDSGQKFGIQDGGRHLNLKKEYQKSGGKVLLVTPEMSDSDIQTAIYHDMGNLAMHEAGTGWMRAGTLLTLKSTDQILGSGFKMLVDQNKIIIRQNELILRNLKEMGKR